MYTYGVALSEQLTIATYLRSSAVQQDIARSEHSEH
jgi:hypothetical protein